MTPACHATAPAGNLRPLTKRPSAIHVNDGHKDRPAVASRAGRLYHVSVIGKKKAAHPRSGDASVESLQIYTEPTIHELNDGQTRS